MSIELSRRTMLRGLGACMALPWLESLVPNVARAAAGVAAKPPVRMAFIYVPNGKHLPAWFPKHDGVLVDLPYALEPLSFARNDLLVFSGLTHNNARSNGDEPSCDHGRGSTSFLTGAQAYRSQENVKAGISVDQIAAQHLGQETRLPSLELGCEPSRSGNAFGYSGTYKANISWRTPTTPAPYEINPKAVFDRLFAGADTAAGRSANAERDFYRKSILDSISDDASRLQKAVSSADRQKLDQYLSGVREVERRIERSRRPAATDTTMLPRVAGVPADFSEQVRLLGDLMVLAFQTDSTRVATFMWAVEANNRAYPFLGFSDGHHDLSHHGNDAEKHRKLREIDRHHVSLLAYIAERMKSIPEGDGTLLDNSMILYGSGLSDGDRHDHINLPVVVVGKGGGALQTGRHMRYRAETPMCNLFVSMLQAAGIPTDHFGDSTGPLPSLTA